MCPPVTSSATVGYSSGRRLGIEDVGGDVPDEVVHGVQRLVERDGERLRRADADHERSGEPRAAGDRDGVDVVESRRPLRRARPRSRAAAPRGARGRRLRARRRRSGRARPCCWRSCCSAACGRGRCRSRSRRSSSRCRARGVRCGSRAGSRVGRIRVRAIPRRSSASRSRPRRRAGSSAGAVRPPRSPPRGTASARPGCRPGPRGTPPARRARAASSSSARSSARPRPRPRRTLGDRDRLDVGIRCPARGAQAGVAEQAAGLFDHDVPAVRRGELFAHHRVRPGVGRERRALERHDRVEVVRGRGPGAHAVTRFGPCGSVTSGERR